MNTFFLKVDYSDDPRAVRIAAALWWYYASKLFELLGISGSSQMQ